ncbi:MAG TPA: hypothetical protein PK347_02790 [Burkholderiaceae bacterium]|nr:hypothetical protein [Burkholderiaceae bacterium]
MNIVRVNSFFRDALDDYKGSTLVVCCGLDSDKKVVQGVWPGILTNDNVKNPFLLKVDDHSVVWFDDDDFLNTTLGQREIQPKQMFTVDDESVYEIRSVYQYLNPSDKQNIDSIERMVKIKAICTDEHRKKEKNNFVLWCGLDAKGNVPDGEWMGYYEDEENVWPIIVTIGKYSEVDYGNNIKDWMDLRSGKIGDRFIIKVVDEENITKIYNYEILEQHVF